MSQKVKKVLSIITTVLVVLLVGFALTISIVSVNSKKNDDVPTLFGHTVFAIQTDSMEDEIKVGDIIFGNKVDAKDLKVGDIISFKAKSNEGVKFINTHRIVEIIDNGYSLSFRTKGDNVESTDLYPVPEGDIVSIYNGTRIPFMGKVLTFLQSQVGFFIVFVFPVLLYTIWQVVKLVQVIANNKKVEALESATEIAESSEYKEKIIAEYLAKQKEKEEKEKNGQIDNKDDENQNDKSDTE